MQPGTTGLRYIQAQYMDVPCAIEIGVAMPPTEGSLQKLPVRAPVEDLLLIWTASEAEECR